MVEKTKKEDGLINLIGHFGKWQCLIVFSLSVVKLSTGWTQMAIIFLTPKLTYWCKSFENSSVIGDNMTCYSDCLKYDYDTSPFGNTIISEWDLVCDRGWLTSFTQTMLQFGILVGSIVFGFLSDRWGRKNTFLASTIGVIGFGFGIVYSPNYTTFTALRFLLGVATAGTNVISFVIVVEIIGPKYREVIGCLFQIPFILGHMTTPVFAYFYRDWDKYSLALAVPPLIYLGYFIVLTESPRWLVSMGKVDAATKLVNRAAEMNGRPTTNVEDTLKKMADDIKKQSTPTKPNYTDLLRGTLLLKTVPSCFIWMITGLSFYGLNQYIGQTSSDPFITVGAAALIQVPSKLVSIWLLRHFGRKSTVITFFTLGGLCVLTLGFVPHTFWTTLTLGCIGVSCASIVTTCIYIYTSELFPTVVRNMGMGASSTFMRIGSMIAPFVSDMSATIPWLPSVIFGVTPILGALVCITLPETRGAALTDNIERRKGSALTTY